MYNLADKIRFHFKSTLRLCDSQSIAFQYINSLEPHELHDGDYTEYYEQHKPLPSINYSLLRSIVDKTEVLENQEPAFAIHLRLGDKLINKLDISNLLSQIISKHHLNQKYNLCRIYYGFHNSINVEESLDFIKIFKKYIASNFSCNVKLISNDADSDFCGLSNETCMIPTQGGFSWLAGSINPNNVIWDLFDLSHWHPHDSFQIQSGKLNQSKIKI